MNFFVWSFLRKVSVKCWRVKFCRKIGIRASLNDNLQSPLKDTYLTLYLEIGLSMILGVYVIYLASADEVHEFFESGTIVATLMAMIGFVIFFFSPFYVHHVVRENFKRLDDPDVLKVHGPLYQEMNTKSYFASLFYCYQLSRRAFLIMIMVLLRDNTLLQINLYVTMHVISLGILLQF